jgi:hypothetical protein
MMLSGASRALVSLLASVGGPAVAGALRAVVTGGWVMGGREVEGWCVGVQSLELLERARLVCCMLW